MCVNVLHKTSHCQQFHVRDRTVTAKKCTKKCEVRAKMLFGLLKRPYSKLISPVLNFAIFAVWEKSRNLKIPKNSEIWLMIFREIESFFRILLPSRLAMKDAVTYFSKSTKEVNGPPTNRFVRSMKILKVLS